MSAVIALLCSTLMFVVFVSADHETITVKSGENVTLTCRAPNNKIIFLQWRRTDLGNNYVLFYRNGRFDPGNKHPSFKNRVDLQDRQMKDGDMSLILKNVTINDAGRYVCFVFMEETHSLMNISIINLIVVPPDPKVITAGSGQDVTLTCRAPNNKITAVIWSRNDLKPGFILLYESGHFVPDDQHPSFKNRVDLQDRQMKDGDVSLILKDVTINDAGTYLCYVLEETGSLKLISIIYLFVRPGILGGYPEWMVALIVCVVLLLGTLVFLLFFFLIYTKIQKQKMKLRKQVGRSARFSKLKSESPPAVPKSHCYRRKKDDQGQKETNDADLQSPQMNCESDDLRTDINELS